MIVRRIQNWWPNCLAKSNKNSWFCKENWNKVTDFNRCFVVMTFKWTAKNRWKQFIDSTKDAMKMSIVLSFEHIKIFDKLNSPLSQRHNSESFRIKMRLYWTFPIWNAHIPSGTDAIDFPIIIVKCNECACFPVSLQSSFFPFHSSKCVLYASVYIENDSPIIVRQEKVASLAHNDSQ